VTPGRFVTIHGHFYQPPRENPWLESVEVQDSAAPYHDWNERVTAECYAPNTAARRVREDNRILDVVNNFEKISFNVGPTLMAWLERHRRDVYDKILEADRASARARGGHGNAIAQVYNHMILPLATRADKITQVRWGVEDFRARFGREPEGMWLPETAVDNETLAVLAEAGLRFTILAPHQAWRVRRLGGVPWEEVNERVDPSRPYLWRGPGGLELALFFYDAPISRAIAFEDALARGENLVRRLRAGFADGREGAQLVHCATDGESYGHHRSFGDMALAAAVQQVEAEGFAQLTNYGAFLAAHPPRHEVEIRERTAWSCAHGVERWRADCGCRMRSDSHQRWRAPLRAALDWLREQVDPFFEARAGSLLKDPWAARDAYVEVILDRTPAHVDRFLAAHQRIDLDARSRVEARRLLELQRHRLLMYTSCGWFFDDIAGLEPVQVLKYAAMALQYVRDLGGPRLETEFVGRLAAAPSNASEHGDAAEVYRRLVRPAVVDLRRVVAHYAITDLFEPYGPDAAVYAYRVRRLDDTRERFGATEVRTAHVRVRSTVTGDEADVSYAVVHFGGHDFACGVRGYTDVAGYEAVKNDLLARYGRGSMTELVRALDQHFPGELFSLRHLFLEERRRVLTNAITAVLQKHEETYRRIWEENRKLVRDLREVDVPIPEALALVARHVLEQDALAELSPVAAGGAVPPRVFDLATEAMSLGLRLDLTSARPALQDAVHAALDAIAAAPTPASVAKAIGLVEGATRLGLRYGRWAAQNEFFALWRARPEARGILVPLADALGFTLATETPS
jgi:alpha-amylase/alpha-mannosidase (GH57 family)